MIAVVGLGCGFLNCEASVESRGRAVTALEFAKLIGAEVLVLSGGHTDRNCKESEAKSMLNSINGENSHGITIMLEERSMTTLENAEYTCSLLAQLKSLQRIYVVTSCYHMARSVQIFSDIFKDVMVLPGTCYQINPLRLESEAAALKKYLGRDRGAD